MIVQQRKLVRPTTRTKSTVYNNAPIKIASAGVEVKGRGIGQARATRRQAEGLSASEKKRFSYTNAAELISLAAFISSNIRI